MLKLLATAAVALSGSAFLFESHAMIWLVAALLPGAVAVLLGPAARPRDGAAGREIPAGIDLSRRSARGGPRSPRDGHIA